MSCHGTVLLLAYVLPLAAPPTGGEPTHALASSVGIRFVPPDAVIQMGQLKAEVKREPQPVQHMRQCH